jgi:hypothetical protein
MTISSAELIAYPLPKYLMGRCTPSMYIKWLNNKADTLLKRDKKREKPYAAAATVRQYKGKIHRAVMQSNGCDPYTGDALAWELIGTWDTSSRQPDGYKKKFGIMPTVDHVDPAALEFEICSWLTNDAKSDLNPDDFIKLCKRVVTFRKKSLDG